MTVTNYKGDDVDTTFSSTSEYGDENVYCPNDECKGIEVVMDECEDCAGGCVSCNGTGQVPVEVIRLTWDSRPVAHGRYEPGYDRDPSCPKCGEDGEAR